MLQGHIGVSFDIGIYLKKLWIMIYLEYIKESFLMKLKNDKF